MLRELASRHGWFSIVTVYSRRYSRAYRVTTLLTSILTVMFTSAMMYALLYPDPHPCAAYTDEEDCLAEKSTFNKHQDNCYWTDESQSCAFNEPSSSFAQTLVVSIIATILANPIGAFIDWLFQKYLLDPVPIEDTKGESEVSNLRGGPWIAIPIVVGSANCGEELRQGGRGLTSSR